jgi:hypothetical protein
MNILAKSFFLTALIAGVGVFQGCATKTYGRQGLVTDYEKSTLSCREIDLEIARTHGFIAQVNKESEFSGRDVLAILGDFGIGNSLERGAAIESANRRIDQLGQLRANGRCTGESRSSAPDVPAQAPDRGAYVIPPPR